MNLPHYQYSFKDGQWVDVWNGDTPCVGEVWTHATWAEEILADQLLCGCGEAGELVEVFAALIDEEKDGLILMELDTWIEELVVNVATMRGLIDHGTSLRVSWVTPAGRAWRLLVGE